MPWQLPTNRAWRQPMDCHRCRFARPDGFEPPSTWFEGTHRQLWVFNNQPLAALASRLYSL